MSGSAGTVTFPYYIDPDCNTKTTDENSGAESEGVALEYDPIKDSTVPLISTIDYNVVSGNKATDVGNNILVIEGTGNYKGEAKAPWTLVAKEVTITGDDFSARIGSTVDLSEKFNASGSLSYEITGANTTGSSASGSTLTVGGTAGNFQLKVSAAATTNYKAVEKIVTVKGRFVKEPQKQSFADVPADAYPGRPCTRAQIVTFLYHVYSK